MHATTHHITDKIWQVCTPKLQVYTTGTSYLSLLEMLGAAARTLRRKTLAVVSLFAMKS